MLTLNGGLVLGLAGVQLFAGVLKAMGVNVFVFFVFAVAQLGAAGVLAFQTFEQALPSLTSSAPAPPLPDLSFSSALAWVAAASIACFVTFADVLISLAYVVRGVPTDDIGACYKVMVLFSLPGFVVQGAALARLSFDVQLLKVVPLGSASLTSNTALLLAYIGLGIAGAGMLAVFTLALCNLAVSVGNRRFAMAWSICLFLIVIPVGVLLGVASLKGGQGSAGGGYLYIALSVFAPIMSFAFTITKESFVLEKYKDGNDDAYY